jgi:hypothetical protein
MNKLAADIKAIPRGQPYGLSTTMSAPELPERAGALPVRLQDIARQYIGARHKSGQALLEAARWLSEARQEAKHGEWKVFLEATGTSDDTAERLLNIHAQSMQNPQFADFVRTQWIGQSAAALLSAPSTPPEIIDQVLRAPDPPTVASIKSAIKEAKQPPTPEQPATDAGKVAAIQRYLDQQRAAGRTYDKATFNAAWELAHEIHDGDTWRDITKAIHAQTNGGKGAPVAPPAAAAPFWQATYPNHATAHLWTRERPDLLRSACGQTIQNRLPSGSTEAGHCSSCVRATWPQNQAEEPKIPEVTAAAPARLTCPTCGEAILNGIWGELEECGSCYHARVRVPTPPDLATLDATIPPALEQAGYYWHSATPPIIAHNDGWRGERPTIEQALQLAWDRERAKGEAQSRRLTPGAHAQAMTLLNSIRTDLITDHIDQAEAHARQLLSIIEKGEAED